MSVVMVPEPIESSEYGPPGLMVEVTVWTGMTVTVPPAGIAAHMLVTINFARCCYSQSVVVGKAAAVLPP